MRSEYEIRWNGGRAYRNNKADAIAYAKALNDSSACVIFWGPGYIVWAA